LLFRRKDRTLGYAGEKKASLYLDLQKGRGNGKKTVFEILHGESAPKRLSSLLGAKEEEKARQAPQEERGGDPDQATQRHEKREKGLIRNHTSKKKRAGG